MGAIALHVLAGIDTNHGTVAVGKRDCRLSVSLTTEYLCLEGASGEGKIRGERTTTRPGRKCLDLDDCRRVLQNPDADVEFTVEFLDIDGALAFSRRTTELEESAIARAAIRLLTGLVSASEVQAARQTLVSGLLISLLMLRFINIV